MRPVKLVMSAFGPYAEVQTVDFREAIDAGLFGIYGPTGSGKSSIFSAITFALFGKSAREEQPIATLRSTHSGADTLTFAALVFEIGDKRYLVRREPDQLRPKSRGEGETVHAHAAWLFDVSGIAVDAVDVNGCGVVLAEKKVSQVNEQVRTLLGYGDEQFRQIVLLPQGRFERFLVSNSAERLRILRELFDVSLYRSLAERLKGEAAEARRTITDGFRLHGQRLQSEGVETSDELDAGIAAARAENTDLERAATAAETNDSRAAVTLGAAEAIETRFAEANQAAELLDRLRGEGGAVARDRLRRDNAVLARRAADVHDAIAAASGRHAAAVTAANDAEHGRRAAASTLADAEAALALEKGRAADIDTGTREVERLSRYATALRDAADLKAIHDEQSSKRIAAEAALQTTDERLGLTRSLQHETEAALAVAQRDLVTLTRLQGERTALAQRASAVRAHESATHVVEQARQSLAHADHAAAESAQARTTAADAVATSEAAFLEAQASLLAARLADGEACPVCGAHEHPAPAHGDGDPRERETEWKAARETLAAANAREQETLVARGAAKSLLEERVAQLATLAVPTGDHTSLERDLARVDDALQALGECGDPVAIETQIFGQVEASAAAQRDHDAARVDAQRAVTAEAVALRSYEDQIADIPERLRDDVALNDMIEAAKAMIVERQSALVTAQQQHREAANVDAAATAAHDAAVRTRDAAVVLVNEAEQRFQSRLAEIGLLADQYAAYVDDIAEIDILSAAIASYDQALRQAEGAASQAAAAIANTARPDIAALREARDSARATAEAARRTATNAGARLAQLEKLKRELADAIAALTRLEADTGPLRTLAMAFQGENDMQTPLESFAIGTMFDQVLIAANLRFEPMTSGRYQFERDVESSGGRAKRGLDIRVHDIHTGRPRELSTLSGGETFIAALALALGLSDIVEASHGAIRLDTIFIDEGFGSLDTDNDSGTLDVVLQVLRNIVSQNRAVGLISHVPLVQQAVPNGFNILKGAGGNMIEVRDAAG